MNRPQHVLGEQEWKAAPRRVIDLDARRERLRRTYFSNGTALQEARRELDTRRYLTKAEFLSKQEAGQIVQLHPKTIEREIGRGKIRAFKLSGKTRIRREDLETWIEANVVEPSIHDI